MTGRPRASMLALTLLVVSSAAGCVIPLDDAAAPVESVPDGVLTATTVTPTTSPEPELDEPAFNLELYWNLDNGALIQVVRRQDESATLSESLEALVNGPTDDEIEEHAELGVILPRVVESLNPMAGEPDINGVIIITVADDFGLRQNDDAKIPIAEELVCTVTQFESITGVLIADSAGPIPLPDENSEPIDGAADRSNYSNCEEALDTESSGA